jgi:hypothetical protein
MAIGEDPFFTTSSRIIAEDPFPVNVTTSVIQPNHSEDNSGKNHDVGIATDPFDNIYYTTIIRNSGMITTDSRAAQTSYNRT